MSRIYIAYTGGTIGMKKNTKGNWEPAPNALTNYIKTNKEVKDACLKHKIITEINEYPNLIDSSKISPENWQQIIEDISDNYEEFDGFVIIHGTDTMAYTSSVLSFFLVNVAKPVVLTGAQRSVFVNGSSDGTRNLINAFKVASGIGGVREVCVLFDSAIIRGNRATKISAVQDFAFISPTSKLLGIVRGGEIETYKQRFVSLPKGKFYSVPFAANEKADVVVIKLFPGFNPDILRQLVAISGIRGVVIEAYGQGNAPESDEFESALKLLKTNKIAVVVTSQPIHGKVTLTYETSAAFKRAGAISGDEMTTEAAVAKLFYLFNTEVKYENIRDYFDRSLRGERSDGRYFPSFLAGHLDEGSMSAILKEGMPKPIEKREWIEQLNSRLSEAISCGLNFEAIFICHVLINDRINSLAGLMGISFDTDKSVLIKIDDILNSHDASIEQVFGVRDLNSMNGKYRDLGLLQPIVDWYQDSFNFSVNYLADPMKIKLHLPNFNPVEFERLAMIGKNIQNSLSARVRTWRKRTGK